MVDMKMVAAAKLGGLWDCKEGSVQEDAWVGKEETAIIVQTPQC